MTQKILVVDDSEIVLDVVSLTLQDAGFEVSTVGSAFKLNAAIREFGPDLILLDVMMPALSGTKAAEILGQYKFSREIPILLHSDLESDELERLVAQTGVSGFVKKSAYSLDLVPQLKAWLEQLDEKRVEV
jgi:CheY-like chemotaxis protein